MPSSSIFGATPRSAIRLAYVDPQMGLVEDVSINDANRYAELNPGTVFIFRDGRRRLRYLTIREVNRLTAADIQPPDEECSNEPIRCGEPRIQFWGGGGLGAAANPVVSASGSLIAVDLVRGGHGYQFAPFAAARDSCNIGSGAVIEPRIGIVAAQTETFDEIEEYEIEDETGELPRDWGADGQDLGAWNPDEFTGTELGGDPIERQIEQYLRILRQIENPFWTSRRYSPRRITAGSRTYSRVYPVTHEASVTQRRSVDVGGSPTNSEVTSNAPDSTSRNNQPTAEVGFSVSRSRYSPGSSLRTILRQLNINEADFRNGLEVILTPTGSSGGRTIEIDHGAGNSGSSVRRNRTVQRGATYTVTARLNTVGRTLIRRILSEISTEPDLNAYITQQLSRSPELTLRNGAQVVGDGPGNKLTVDVSSRSGFNFGAAENAIQSLGISITLSSGQGTFNRDSSGNITYTLDTPRSQSTRSSGLINTQGNQPISSNTSQSTGGIKFITQNNKFYLDARQISGRVQVNLRFLVADTRRGHQGYAALRFEVPGTPIVFDRRQNAVTLTNGTYNRSFTIDGGRLYGPVKLTGATRGSTQSLSSANTISSYDPGTSQTIRRSSRQSTTQTRRVDRDFDITLTSASIQTTETRRTWNDFMNTYAVCPVPASTLRGSDNAGILFSIEWDVNFPFDGDYIFRGCRDNEARLYIDDQFISDLQNFNEDPQGITRRITRGNHSVRVDLLNTPQYETVIDTPSVGPSTSTASASNEIICHAAGGSGGKDDSPVRTGGRVVVGRGGAGQGSDDDDATRRGGGAGLRGGSNAGRAATGARGVTINGTAAAVAAGYGFGGNGSPGTITNLRVGGIRNLTQALPANRFGATAGGDGRVQIGFSGRTREYGPGTHEFTVPSGVTSIEVRCIGGGGSGFIDNNGDREGSGGAGGAFAYATSEVKPGDILRITVGAGGRVPSVRGSQNGGDTLVQLRRPSSTRTAAPTAAVELASTTTSRADIAPRPVFDTVSYIARANRPLWRINPEANGSSDHMGRYGVLPFNIRAQAAESNSYAGTHTILWENITFPVSGNYTINITVDDNVTLYIGNRGSGGRANDGTSLRSTEAGGEEVVIRKQGFSRPSVSTGTSRYTRYFRAGSYRIRADLEQISGRNLSQGNPMALAINIETAYTERRVQRSMSWQQNPFGVALTIQAPEPPIPQEPPTQQVGRCPNNPIWSTRFPGALERWYPVRYTGVQSPNPTPSVPSTSTTATSTTSTANRTASSAPRNSAQTTTGSTQRVQFSLSRSSSNDLRNTVSLVFTPRSGNGGAIRFTNDIVRNRSTTVAKTLRRNVAYTVTAEFTSAASRNRIAIPLLNSQLTIRRATARTISLNIGRPGDIAGTDLVLESPSGAGTFTQSRDGTIEYEIVGSGSRPATTTNTRTNTSSTPNRARFINQNGQIFLDARGISGRATVEFEFTVRDTQKGGGYAARSFSIPGTPINFVRSANRNTRDGTGEASRSFNIEGGRLYGPVRLTGAARGSSTQLRSETLLSSFDPGTTTRIRQNNGRLPTEGDRLDFNIRISRTRVSNVTPPPTSTAPTPAAEDRRSGSGWGQFMNRYALSPVPPLLSLGSDRSGITFTNSWPIRIPFTGQYAVKGCADNRGRILIDGNEVAQMDGFRNDNPTVHRVTLTQGEHIITAEVYNEPQTITTTTRNVVFSTVNFPRPADQLVATPTPSTRRVICQAAGGSGGKDDQPVRTGGRVVVGNGGAGQGSDDDDATRRGGGAGLRGGGNAGRSTLGANGVTINGTAAGDRSGYGFGGNGSPGTGRYQWFTGGGGGIRNLTQALPANRFGASNGGNGAALVKFNGNTREYNPGTHEFVVPSGVTSIEVRCIGGGGSGFNDNNGDREGSGGAGGAFSYVTASVNPGDRLRIVVGAGGRVPSVRGSQNGGDTTIEILPAATRGNTARAAAARSGITTSNASSGEVSYDGPALLQTRYTNSAWGDWMNRNNVTIDFSGIQPAQTERINGYSGPGVYLDLRDIRGNIELELRRVANESSVNHGVQFRGIGTINESDRPVRTFTVQGGRVYGPITPTARVNNIKLYIGSERVPGIRDSGSRPNTQVVVEERGDDWDDFVVSTSRGRFVRLTSGEVTQRPSNSPPTSIVGDFTLRWNNINFPETGQYTIRLQSDDDAVLKINNNEIRRTGASFRGEPTPFFATITAGVYPVEVVLTNSNNGENPNTNPCGVSLEIVKDVSVSTTAGTSWQGGNPVGISAVLIAPPCPRPTGGGGVVVGVDVIDPGNNYEPPAPNSPSYPVTLQITGVNVQSPGINYSCGIDTVRLVPDNGAVLRYSCESFGRITSVIVESPGEPINDIPRIEVVTNTGVGFDATPVVEVVRDPIGIGTDRIIQVTDLVGLKQTGYINGRPYYGAVFFEDGVPYAGYYRTAGTPVRVYATLEESITGRVTTVPSAIQRSGTDITGNDPRLNIPGTPENLI